MVLAFAEGQGRVAAVDGPGLEVAGSDSAEAKHGPFADADAGSYEGVGTDPGVGVDMDAVSEERETGVVVVVGGAAEIAILGEDHVRGEVDRCGVIDLGAVAGGDVVGTVEVPRGPNTRAWIEVAVGAEGGAEAAEQERAPAVEWTG